MSGAEAEVRVGEDVVQLQVDVRSGQIGGAAAYKLFEVTAAGDVEVARLGSDHPSAYLPVPRPGSYFAEVTDARGRKHRTQTLPVESAFFDLAVQRGRETREFKAKQDAQKKQAAQETAARAAAAAQAAQAARTHQNELLVGGIVAVLVVAGLIVLYLLVFR